MVILETLEHALSRKAAILAEVVGYGSTADAFRITDQDPEGMGAVVAMTSVNATARSFFIAALVFSLIGDVFLMLPDREKWFVFFVVHVYKFFFCHFSPFCTKKNERIGLKVNLH